MTRYGCGSWERAGTWDQHFGKPEEFTELATRSLPEGVAAGSPQEREAVLAILHEQIRDHQLMSAPLTATYIRGLPGGPSYLTISVHGIVGTRLHATSCSPTSSPHSINGWRAKRSCCNQFTSWREWSQRCAALATHPAVMESRDYWLETASPATLSMAGPEASEPPGADDLARLSSALTVSETGEVDDARRRLRLPVDEILLAALGRTVAATVGEGTVAVDLGGRVGRYSNPTLT